MNVQSAIHITDDLVSQFGRTEARIRDAYRHLVRERRLGEAREVRERFYQTRAAFLAFLSEGREAAPPHHHNYKVGDAVTVQNMTIGGHPFVEGEAIVRRLLDDDHYYGVEFVNEPGGATYDRFVR